MKATAVIVLFFLACFLACQEKYLTGLNRAGTGSLQSDGNADCLPKTIGGIFFAGKETADTNFIFVSVNAKSTGSYLINTNTVNGYSFAGSGNFTTTGIKQVKLAARGKPLTAGTNDFTVKYDTSLCVIKITVLPPGGIISTPASYTFPGGPNACMNAIVSGNYVKTVLVDTASKILITVNVITPGAYAIATNTLNGYGFSGSGTFITTGLQIITLKASGTPLNAGLNDFTVSGSSSNCTFPVTVLVAVPVVNNDHFPLTHGSYWTYDDLFNTGDTLKKSIIDSAVINSKQYRTLEQKNKIASPVQSSFTRWDSTYYEYTTVDKYTRSFKFNPEIVKEIPFLKEYLVTGAKWNTEEYIGTASFGQKIFFRYEFTCSDANAVATINGKTFINVYKMNMRPQIRSELFYPYAYTGERTETWYAKGIGIIYTKTIRDSFTLYEQQLRNWEVN